MMRRFVPVLVAAVWAAAAHAADDARPAANAATAQRAPAATAAGAAGKAAGPGSRTDAGVRDRVELDKTQITGNRELPKVMYVVPWKKPDLGDLGGGPAKSLLEEILEPLDREVFKRQNRYFEAMQGDAAQRPVQ